MSRNICISLQASVALGVALLSGAAAANPPLPEAAAPQVAEAPARIPTAEEQLGIVQNRTDNQLVNKLIEGQYPLTPEQQILTRDYMTYDTKALERRTPGGSTAGDPIYVIDLTQGGQTQEVPLQLGYVSNVMVVGENGAPWPIRRATTGDDTVVSPEIVEGSSTALELSPKRPWVTTNLHIYLDGRNESIKLYTRVSADPTDGLRDAIKIVVDGIPPGSSPLLQPNRIAVDSQLMNALGQAPGRNWAELRVQDADRFPFRLSYWMAPNAKGAIVRLRNAQMVGPDWAAETRDPDGTTRVYKYETPVPLLLRIRDSSGLEHQVRLDNPADLLAGKNTTRTLTVKQTSPARPPVDSALNFEPPVGMVNRDRTQAITRNSKPVDDLRPQYTSFDGKGARTNRVQIVEDLTLSRDTAKRLIEETHRSRPILAAPATGAPTGTSAVTSPAPADKPFVASPPLASASGAAAPVSSAPISSAPAASEPVAAAPISAVATTSAAPVASIVKAAPPKPSYSMSVKAGGLYDNLYAYTEKHGWKAPLWDLGDQDIVITSSYEVTGDSPAEVLSKFLEPYSKPYNFQAEISRTGREVWVH
ncbi:DotH/IcmK family type IV secretion protein [Geopseudomonas aromaticivorans]